MDNRVLQSMVIAPVVEEEVLSIITSLNDSSAGLDAISSRVIKATYSCFLTPLTHVVNISLLNGVFPSELKIARVKPLFKSGEPSNFSNYRPVSVLPLFSKILERLMYTRLRSFITKHNILYAFQFGFRKFHSPNLALIILIDRISKVLENGDYVMGLFLDFSKALDTVNHFILYKKIECYGVRGLALKWFQSYLSEREQILNIIMFIQIKIGLFVVSNKVRYKGRSSFCCISMICAMCLKNCSPYFLLMIQICFYPEKIQMT